MVSEEETRERGKTGARRKPLEQKALEGNRNKEGKSGQKKFKKALKTEKGFTKANKNGAPKPPETFGKVAQEKWYFLFTELQVYLKSVDLDALRIYCQAWEEYVELSQTIAEEGFTIYNNQGNKVRNPAFLSRNVVIDKLHKYGMLLGLNPSSRQKILESSEVEDDGKDDPWSFMED